MRLTQVIPTMALAAAAVLAALAATAVVGAPESFAKRSGCANASTPAFRMPSRQARKATLCLLNKIRHARGMGRLADNAQQRKAAKKHTRRMIAKHCFSHQCPGEGDLVSRISATGYLPCNCYWGVGENIAYGHGSTSTPARIVHSWMKSAGHRHNILNRRFEHIGIGIDAGAPAGSGKAATYTTTFGYRD